MDGMTRRIGWLALAALLFVGTGAARFLHLHAFHSERLIGGIAPGGHSHPHCRHATPPPNNEPRPAPHSSDRCETCYLIAAAVKGATQFLTVLPAFDALVREFVAQPSVRTLAFRRLDSASQRGPPLERA
jgi:hypothetical protein